MTRLFCEVDVRVRHLKLLKSHRPALHKIIKLFFLGVYLFVCFLLFLFFWLKHAEKKWEIGK
jgi:hypothetical protein